MSRSSKKGPYLDPKLLKKVEKLNNEGKKKVIKTWSRDCAIPPEFVGHTFGVHNGKEHIPVFVSESMIGHKLGEFAPTRKFKGHGGKLAAMAAQEGAKPTTAPAAAAAPKPTK